MHLPVFVFVATFFCLPVIVSTSASAQHVTTYDYDEQGRLTKSDPPGSTKRSYSYSVVGNPQEATPTILNRPPTANADQYEVVADAPNRVFDPKANDTDADGDAVSLTWVGHVRSRADDGSGRQVATVALRNDGRISVRGTWPGVATFDYVIADGRYGEASARSSVRVRPGASPPMCGNVECERAVLTGAQDNTGTAEDDSQMPNGDETTVGEGQ